MLPVLVLAALFASDPPVLKARSLETRELTVKHPDGKGKIYMCGLGGDHGVGIWMDNGHGGPMITLVATKDRHTWFGFYDNAKGGKDYTPSLAISIDGERPSIQYRDKHGKIRHCTVEDLRNLPVKKKVKKKTTPCCCPRRCR